MLFAKNQYSIPRGVLKKCELCTKQFGVFLRQHLCKRCFRTVCSDCSKTKRPVYKLGFTKVNHRLCKICKDFSDFTISFVKNKNLHFGSMSMLGTSWLSKIKKPRIVGMTNQKQNAFTKEHFQELWDSYSYEFRQNMGLLTFEYQQQNIYSMINTVYRTAIAVQSEQQIPNVIYLVVTLLGFSSPEKAMILVLSILQMKNQIKNIKQTIFNILKEYPMHSELLRLEKYITYRFQKHFFSFMINGVSFQSLIHILSKIFEKGNLQQLFYFFCSHIFTNRQLLVNFHTNNELCDLNMLRFCSKQLICQNYKYIKNKNLIEYIDQRSTKSEIILPESFQHMRKTQNSFSNRIFQAQIQPIKLQKGLIKRQITKEEQPSFQQSFSQIDIENFDDSIQTVSYNENNNVLANLVDLIPSELKIRSVSNDQSDKILERMKKELDLKQQRIAELEQQKKMMKMQNIPTVQYVTIVNDLKKKPQKQTVSNEEYQQALRQINEEKDMRMRYEQQINKMNELLLEMNSKIEVDRVKLEEKQQQHNNNLLQINQLEILLKNMKEEFNKNWKMKIQKEEQDIKKYEGKLSMNKLQFQSNLEAVQKQRDHYKEEINAKTIQVKEYKNIITENNDKFAHFEKKIIFMESQMAQKLKLISDLKTKNQNLSSVIEEKKAKEKRNSVVHNLSLLVNNKNNMKSHFTTQSIYSIQISPKRSQPASSKFAIYSTLEHSVRPLVPVQSINPESNSPKDLSFSLNNISYSFESFSVPSKLDQKQQIIGQLRLKIQQLKQTLTENQVQLTNIQILTSSSKSDNKFTFNELKKRVKQIQHELNNKNSQIQQLNKTIKSLNSQLQKVQVSKKGLINKFEDMSELMMKFQAENMELRDEIFELNQALQHRSSRIA